MAERKLVLSRQHAEELYAEHKTKDKFTGLVDFMTSGPCVVLILEKPDAIGSWRRLLHSTIRPRFGTSEMHNACHGSDSVESANREMCLLLPECTKLNK